MEPFSAIFFYLFAILVMIWLTVRTSRRHRLQRGHEWVAEMRGWFDACEDVDTLLEVRLHIKKSWRAFCNHKEHVKRLAKLIEDIDKKIYETGR